MDAFSTVSLAPLQQCHVGPNRYPRCNSFPNFVISFFKPFFLHLCMRGEPLLMEKVVLQVVNFQHNCARWRREPSSHGVFSDQYGHIPHGLTEKCYVRKDFRIQKIQPEYSALWPVSNLCFMFKNRMWRVAMRSPFLDIDKCISLHLESRGCDKSQKGSSQMDFICIQMTIPSILFKIQFSFFFKK